MSKLLKFILPVFLVISGVQFTRDYFGGTNKENRNNLEFLISNGDETIGVMQSEYTEKTVKVAKVPIRTYEVGYDFKVQEKDYSGKMILNERPTKSIVQVKYMPEDPSINAANPEDALAKLDEREGQTGSLVIGLGLILVGLVLGRFRYLSLQNVNTT